MRGHMLSTLLGFATLASCGSEQARVVALTDAGSLSDSSTSSDVMAPPEVSGFADLHVHMMAEEAFGGAWFHGRRGGKQRL
jgi:hypothetical protein